MRNVNERKKGPPDDIGDGWSLLRWINSLIAERQPWKISIAEDMKDNEWITKAVGAGGAGFNAQWGSRFVYTVRDAIIGPDDSARDMYSVSNVIGQNYNNDAFQRVIYIESHDTASNKGQRIPETISPGKADSWYAKKRSTLGAAAVLTAPSIPILFIGPELLSWGDFCNNKNPGWVPCQNFSPIVPPFWHLIHPRRNWFNNTL